MFRQKTLDNGLEIIAECNEAAYSLAVGFFVRAGSRDETDVVAGVSHFLEHMMFKGTPTRTAADVNREIDELGARTNAYTSEESTCYYAVVLPELQDRIIDLLGDILRPSLRQNDFEMEKQVILEEIRMYEDQPPYGADEICREKFFGNHPLRRNVLGSHGSITQLTSSQMLAYFHERYSPGNMILAAAGNVDFDALVRKTEQVCGAWPFVSSQRFLTRPVVSGGFYPIVRESSTQQYVMQMFDNVSSAETIRERYAAYLLTQIIGDDVGSRFYWSLLDSGKADSCGFDTVEYADAGFAMMTLSCLPEQTLANMETIEDILRDIGKNGITSDELERCRTKTLSRTVLSGERPSNRLFDIGNEWLQKREYYTMHEEMEFIRQITLEDIHAVLEKYPLDQPFTVTVGSLKTWK
jgi:predicted Zn-dependent peptidase